jgi:uncharacterized membrane protein YebE (DUF533 family)
MARVDDFLDLVDDPSRQTLASGHPADQALLALMVHVAFSDGVVQPNELAFLKKVLPERSDVELLAWVKQTADVPFNWVELNAALPSTEDHWKGLRFAARMAYKDGTIQVEEREFMSESRLQVQSTEIT